MIPGVFKNAHRLAVPAVGGHRQGVRRAAGRGHRRFSRRFRLNPGAKRLPAGAAHPWGPGPGSAAGCRSPGPVVVFNAAGELTDEAARTQLRKYLGGLLISFVIEGRAAEMEPPRRRHDAGMGTHDYWLYSVGLVFVTFAGDRRVTLRRCNHGNGFVEPLLPPLSRGTRVAHRVSNPLGGGMVRLTINGKSHEVDVHPSTPLLWVIREQVGPDRHQVRLRHRAVRILHCPRQRRGHALLLDADERFAAEQKIIMIEGLATEGSHTVQKA